MMGQTMDICGLKEDGSDGTNAISWLAIKAMAAFRTFEPKPVVKYNEKIDQSFMEECYKLLAERPRTPGDYFSKKRHEGA